MRIEVSVITLSYNKPDLIGDAIKSVLGQTLKNFEYILVDNSTDGETRRVIGRYRDKRIKYFEENFTKSFRKKFFVSPVLLNKYYSKVRGKYIIFLADDDVFLPDCLSEMVGFFNENPRAKVCFHDQFIMYSQNGKIAFEPMVRGTNHDLKSGKDSVFFLDGGQVMFKGSLLGKIKKPYLPTDWKQAEDCDKYFLQKLAKDNDFYWVGKALSFKRVFMSSTHRGRTPLKYYFYQLFITFLPTQLQWVLFEKILGKRRLMSKKETAVFKKLKQETVEQFAH